MGHTSHDAVQVPFILPPNVVNEGQFAFSVDSILMPTKMKGTLTYMVNVRIYHTCYHKIPKFSDAKNFAVIYLKFKQRGQTLWHFVQKMQMK